MLTNDDHGFGWRVARPGLIESDCGGWLVRKIKGGQVGFLERRCKRWRIVARAERAESLNCGVSASMARTGGL